MTTHRINGVEVFSTGIHNGDEYTERDLDDIVTAFNLLDYKPALKVGHTKDAPGAPAYGWVENLKRIGSKLVADFVDLHHSVVEAIRTRAYDRVSAEVFFNLQRGGRTFPRALKAVALLGAQVPAVANLVPLHKVQFAECDYMQAEVQPLVWPDFENEDTPEARTRHFREAEASVPMQKALALTLAALNGGRLPTSAHYSEEDAKRVKQPEYPDRGEAGALVHERCLALMADWANRGMGYADALQRVLQADPALAARYRGVSDIDLKPLHKKGAA